MIPSEQCSDDELDSYMEYLYIECDYDYDDCPPAIPCSWISDTPPVCSAPACRAKLAAEALAGARR